jgi:hypothetical protein
MKFYTFPKFKEVVRDYTIHMEERKSEWEMNLTEQGLNVKLTVVHEQS